MLHRMGGIRNTINYLHDAPLDHYHSKYFFRVKPNRIMGIIFTIGIFQFVFISCSVSFLTVLLYYLGYYNHGQLRFDDSFIYLKIMTGISTFVRRLKLIFRQLSYLLSIFTDFLKKRSPTPIHLSNLLSSKQL